MKTIENDAILVIDSHHGIYIPQLFYQQYNSVLIGQMVNDGNVKNIEINVTHETWEDISNVDNEFYWESWEDILGNCKLFSNGDEYFLYMNDGDLFAIPIECAEQMSDWVI